MIHRTRVAILRLDGVAQIEVLHLTGYDIPEYLGVSNISTGEYMAAGYYKETKSGIIYKEIAGDIYETNRQI